MNLFSQKGRSEMARRPLPGSRVSHSDIDDLEAAHGVEIPFRRSTPPPPAPANAGKSIDQIASEVDTNEKYRQPSRSGF
ncbi:hypothetical protein IT407_04885 [Candidatus Uhrbacteria bacterium]|nr:hypothetical protein [Candidatus Uhrbacteria bacterium]